MAEPTQFMFSHKEVATALIKQQGLRSGKWKLVVQFGFAAMNVGGNDAPNDLNPGAVTVVQSVGLNRADDETTGLVVDAAEVNPTGGETKADIRPQRRLKRTLPDR